jgi:peptide/nickel transport system ATP-binding protein
VLVMYAGRVVEELKASELSAAQHPYTRGLMGCLPKLEHDVHPLPTLRRDPAWAL